MEEKVFTISEVKDLIMSFYNDMKIILECEIDFETQKELAIIFVDEEVKRKEEKKRKAETETENELEYDWDWEKYDWEIDDYYPLDEDIE